MAKTDLTAERLRELLQYNQETGEFTWLEALSFRVKVGGEAGCRRFNGYTTICVAKTHYYAHRLAWLYVSGNWPEAQIDHVNGDRSDNRFVNLRPATQAENSQNFAKYTRNTSGYPGVSFDKRRGVWNVGVKAGKIRVRLSGFKSPEEAHAAYLDAKAKLHTFSPSVRHQ